MSEKTAQVLSEYRLPTGLSAFVGIIDPVEDVGRQLFTLLAHDRFGSLDGPCVILNALRWEARVFLRLPRRRADYVAAVGLPFSFRSESTSRRRWIGLGLLGLGIDRHPPV